MLCEGPALFYLIITTSSITATYGQGSEYAGKAINSPRVAKATVAEVYHTKTQADFPTVILNLYFK